MRHLARAPRELADRRVYTRRGRYISIFLRAGSERMRRKRERGKEEKEMRKNILDGEYYRVRVFVEIFSLIQPERRYMYSQRQPEFLSRSRVGVCMCVISEYFAASVDILERLIVLRWIAWKLIYRLLFYREKEERIGIIE